MGDKRIYTITFIIVQCLLIFSIVKNVINFHNFKYSHEYPIVNSSLGNSTICALDNKIYDCWQEYIPHITIQNNIFLYNITKDCANNKTCAENFINVPYIIGYFLDDQFITTNYMESPRGIIFLLTMSCISFTVFLIIYVLCLRKIKKVSKLPYVQLDENELL